MTIQHHPSEILLWEFASSSLEEAGALVIATHLSHCPACRARIREFEALGGVVLDDAPAQPLSLDADALLALVDDRPSGGSGFSLLSPETQKVPRADELIELYPAGDWRWIGPGVSYKVIDVPDRKDIRVFMLKASGGTRLPNHKHSGIEWTSVLKGAFVHALGRFGPGDFDEADSSVEHQPVVEAGAECICIVAMNGQIELQGVFGRMMQPFVRF